MISIPTSLKSSCGDCSDQVDKRKTFYVATQQIVDFCSREKKHAHSIVLIEHFLDNRIVA